MENEKSRSGMYIKSALLAAIGLVLVLCAHFLSAVWESAAHELGFALLVSVFVWLLFEHQASRESEDTWDSRIERVTKNVFQAVLRKDLPKALLDEANNLVLNCSAIRRNFLVTYTLIDSTFIDVDDTESECVLVEAAMEFSMENVSSDAFQYNVSLSLPNPIHPDLKRQVCVNRIEVTKGGEAVQFDLEAAQKSFQEKLDSDSDTAITFTAGQVELQPGEKCFFSANYVMAKEPEDTELLQTRYPTENLRVVIFDQAGSEKRVVFARSVHRRSLAKVLPVDKAPTAKIFKIPGYLLPHQGILIWWKRSSENRNDTVNPNALPATTHDGTAEKA